MNWARIRHIQLADGRPAVAKETDYDARLEAEGLEALRTAGAPVPVVYRVTEHELVLEDLSGTPDWETLGRTLARVHLTSAEEFGWPHDNVIGPLPQPNGGRRRWPDFFVERRIIPFLDALPTHLSRRLALACEGPLPDLVDHDTRPSLIHGDLWSGNVVDGRWLVDPAVSYSDREIELAFSSLFGDLPDTFHRAYADVWRLDDGWEERRPALQLYHLLVHCRIFGGDYVHMVAQRLQHYHW